MVDEPTNSCSIGFIFQFADEGDLLFVPGIRGRSWFRSIVDLDRERSGRDEVARPELKAIDLISADQGHRSCLLRSQKLPPVEQDSFNAQETSGNRRDRTS